MRFGKGFEPADVLHVVVGLAHLMRLTDHQNKSFSFPLVKTGGKFAAVAVVSPENAAGEVDISRRTCNSVFAVRSQHGIQKLYALWRVRGMNSPFCLYTSAGGFKGNPIIIFFNLLHPRMFINLTSVGI